MVRKRPVWTKAMRRQAAENGRKGDREGKRRGGQLGGIVTWCTRTPERQQAIRTMLAQQGGHQRNRSPKARAAQRMRGKAGMARLSAAKAAFLADAGILKSVPALAPVASVASPVVDDVCRECSAAWPWHQGGCSKKMARVA